MQSRFDTIAAAKAWNGANVPPNQETLILVNGIWQRWRFAKGSVAVDATEQTVFAPTSGAASGKWVRNETVIPLRFPWVFNTANDALLFTVPTGFILHVMRVVTQITVDLDGSDTAELGINSDVSLNPGGLGSFTGLLGTGYRGDEGAEINEPQRTTMIAGNILQHNVMSSGYTAGAGYWHVVCSLIQSA